MVITQFVDVAMGGRNMKHYRELGYEDLKMKDIITVPLKHLTAGSEVRIDIICDYCSSEFDKRYADYLKNKGESIGEKDACSNCKIDKMRDTLQEVYGVDHNSKLESTQETRRQNCLEEHGVEHHLQREDVKEKIVSTNMKRYGVSNPMKLKKFSLKCNGFHGLGRVNARSYSKQQKYIQELYEGELNYKIDLYHLDIAFPDEKIYVEYDGGGHELSVKLGRITQERFDEREQRRSKLLLEMGWREIRIISKKDVLPKDNILVSMLEKAKGLFGDSISDFVVFDIDEGSVRYENKDNQYDYKPLFKVV